VGFTVGVASGEIWETIKRMQFRNVGRVMDGDGAQDFNFETCATPLTAGEGSSTVDLLLQSSLCMSL
jgi:hypothetical protein